MTIIVHGGTSFVHGGTSFSSSFDDFSSGNSSNLGAILESTGVGTSGVSSASGTA